MWRIAIATLLVTAACSGDDAASTTPSSSVTTTTTSTTTTVPPVTTSTPSTTTPTTTTTLPSGFTLFTHPQFTALIPDAWSENSDVPAPGAGFREDHIALALPPTSLDISFELQETGFDLDDHIQRLKDDRAAFVPGFRVRQAGEQDVDGVRSVWFEYFDEFEGFQVVFREQVALEDTLLTTFTLISPVEFFEFDAGQFQQVVESFQFS